MKIDLDDLTPFGRLALKLDEEFRALGSAAERMAKVDLESDSGLDEGLKILNKVAESGQSLAAVMQQFAAAMEEARAGAESATRLVAERAQFIQKRREEQDALQEKLEKVKDEVQAVGASLAGYAQPKGIPSDEDKRRIAAELEKLQAPMTRFVVAAKEIKAAAANGRFRRLERQADSVIDSLEASRRKIALALGK